jgi:hypothetical protein
MFLLLSKNERKNWHGIGFFRNMQKIAILGDARTPFDKKILWRQSVVSMAMRHNL